MRLSRTISAYLIQGCFLALMTVLSPFGYYTDGQQQITEPTRTELVEKGHFQAEVIPDFHPETFELPKLPIAFSVILAVHHQQTQQTLKQTSVLHSDGPFFYKKTTQSTSSEDEPLSALPFA
ncbi:MAG: hypothetical protein R8G66_24790 [Cytophagales bacterium]|nr:hypothetical protein [Cytophagales bacterium]